MEDLIEALTILSKYSKEEYPVHCGHDILYLLPDLDTSVVSRSDIVRLEDLGFVEDVEEGSGFISFKYGSC